MELSKSGVSPNERHMAGDTPLIVAARSDQRQVANVLIRLLADATLATPDGTTGLHEAALFDDANLIYVLVEGGADLDARNAEWATPLILAATAGKGQAVAVLRGTWHADLEIANNDGLTALTHAGLGGQKLIVNILIRYRAVYQATDPAGSRSVPTVASRSESSTFGC